MTSGRGTIVVTGGAGFVGSHLVERLRREGATVAVVARQHSDLGRIHALRSEVALHRCDLADRRAVARLVDTIRPVGVFHLAASNIVSGVTAADEDVVAANVMGTANLLAALSRHEYQFFVGAGSFLEYGGKTRALAESDVCEPGELYSITKLAGTLLTRAAGRQGKPTVVFRIFTPYGPRIQPGRLVHELIARALRGEAIRLTQPGVTRDFIFVDDVVDLLMFGMRRAADVRGEIFNAGTGQAVTLGTLVAAVLKITGSRSRIEWNAFRTVAYDDARWQADMTKTFSTFPWRPRHDLASGLAATVAWVRRQLEV